MTNVPEAVPAQEVAPKGEKWMQQGKEGDQKEGFKGKPRGSGCPLAQQQQSDHAQGGKERKSEEYLPAQLEG